jgi:hypothetical protein
MSHVTVSMADVILSCKCWIFLIFSAYTMFLMYPYRKKNKVERDLGFEVARVERIKQSCIRSPKI